MRNKQNWTCDSYKVKIKNFGVSFLIHCVGIGFLFWGTGKNIKVNDIIYVVEMVKIPKIQIKYQKTTIPKKTKKISKKEVETSFSSEKFLQKLNKKLNTPLKNNLLAKTNKLNYSVKIPEIKSINSVNVPNRFSIIIPDWFLLAIKDKIKENWKVERLLSHTSAAVSFRLFRNEKVKYVIIEKSSGNPNFDNSAVEAVKKTQNFPQFPKEITRKYLDIVIEFSTEG